MQNNKEKKNKHKTEISTIQCLVITDSGKYTEDLASPIC